MREFSVYGHTIPADIQVALITRMKAAEFTAADLEQEAIRLGVPDQKERYPVAMRVVDRVLQSARKRDWITFKRPYWHWNHPVERPQ